MAKTTKTIPNKLVDGNKYIIPSASAMVVATYFLAKLFTDANEEQLLAMAAITYLFFNNLFIVLKAKLLK